MVWFLAFLFRVESSQSSQALADFASQTFFAMDFDELDELEESWNNPSELK